MLNLTLGACYRGYETQKQTGESVVEKQQRSFHCQGAGTVLHLSMKHSQKSNQCFILTVKLCPVMPCKLIGVHPLFYSDL